MRKKDMYGKEREMVTETIYRTLHLYKMYTIRIKKNDILIIISGSYD